MPDLYGPEEPIPPAPQPTAISRELHRHLTGRCDPEWCDYCEEERC